MREQMEKIAKGANNRSAREVLRETAIAGEDFDADDDVDKCNIFCICFEKKYLLKSLYDCRKKSAT